MKLMSPDKEKPPVGELVFALNTLGNVGLVYWNGTDWLTAADNVEVNDRISHWIKHDMDSSQ